MSTQELPVMRVEVTLPIEAIEDSHFDDVSFIRDSIDEVLSKRGYRQADSFVALVSRLRPVNGYTTFIARVPTAVDWHAA